MKGNVMRMTRGLLCTAFFIFHSLFFISCNDFLDKEPDDRVELATEDQIIMLLTGSYPDSNYGWFCESGVATPPEFTNSGSCPFSFLSA